MGEKALEREKRKENIGYRKEERELGGSLFLIPISPFPFPLFSFPYISVI